MRLPKHLGGHLNKTHIDNGALHYLKDKLLIKSMLDVGCGPGGMVYRAREIGIDSFGIDGDFTTIPKDSFFSVHDYQDGPSDLREATFDLVWSCEFVEHVFEEYIPNYVADFLRGKYLLMTHSESPNGYHHVNIKNEGYWIDKMKSFGFELDEQRTKEVRAASTMKKKFVQKTGLLFKNANRDT